MPRDLPAGWASRATEVFMGRALILRTLGRIELLMSKLFALRDRGIDMGDCIALAPTVAEIEEVSPWLEQRDANPEWPAHVRVTMAEVRRRLEHGL